MFRLVERRYTLMLRADLAALVAVTGITWADIDEAVENTHVRSSLYHEVIPRVVASKCWERERDLAVVLLRDPDLTVAKSATVELVDWIANMCAEPAEFRNRVTRFVPEMTALSTKGEHFVRERVNWTVYLTIKAGQAPTSAELTQATAWMQRYIATDTTSLPALTILAESGRTKKIRNIAGN
jgi:hypothetical protein